MNQRTCVGATHGCAAVENGVADGMPDTVQPMWFGPAGRPLLGWLHAPPGGVARGGVVLCPPFGVEMSFSHMALRVLAQRLTDAGLAVLRFDYDGTGQSAGKLNDPRRLASWTASVGHAVDRLRAERLPWVAGVGFRLGATLLAHAVVDGCELDLELLWDPCLSGTTFLREHVALQSTFRHEPIGDAGLEIPGYHLAPETADELRRLELPESLGPRAGPALVLLDPTGPQNRRIRRRLGGDEVEWREYAESASVLDIGERLYDLPTGVIDQVAASLAERAPRETVRLGGEPAGRPTAIVGHSPAGTPLVEEVVTLGATGLVGIACSPVGTPSDAPQRPTILFVSMAAEPSIGPARLWVRWAREWAAAGYRSVRFDLSGIGESPCRPGRRPRHIYAPWALDDIAEAAAAVSPADPGNVILVGVCSGAYSALAVAPHIGPRGVVAINPVLTVGAFDHWTPAADPGEAPVPAAPGRRVVRRLRGAVGRRIAALRDVGRGVGWWRHVVERLPPPVWSLIYRLRLAHSPSSLIAPILAADVPTLLLCGDREARLPRARTPAAFRRLAAAPGSRFTVVPDLDHSLRDASSRATADAVVRGYVEEVGGVGAARNAAVAHDGEPASTAAAA